MSETECTHSELVKVREKVHCLEVSVARLQEQSKASAEALVIANDNLKHAQTVANEWRKENIDQRALYPTIGKVEGMFTTESSERRALEARVNAIEKIGSQATGRGGAFSDVWLKFVAVFAMVVSALGLIYGFLARGAP